MGMNKVLLIVIMCSFMLTFVSAVPPVTTTQQFTEGYIIENSPQTYLKENQDYIMNFFVYNISNGVVVDNSSTNCIFYLANSSGNVLTSGNATFYVDDGYWNYNIGGNNFSVGNYFYGIKCQDTDLGGAIVGEWEVTPNGFEPNISKAIIQISFILLIFGISGLFLILTFKVEQTGLKIFFLVLSFILMISCLILSTIASTETNVYEPFNNAINTFIFSFGLILFVVFAYLMIEIIRASLNSLQEKKGYEIGL